MPPEFTPKNRPFYEGRDLPFLEVKRDQDRQIRSRLLPTEEGYEFRNLALTLRDLLAALPVLSTLVSDELSKIIVDAVLDQLKPLYKLEGDLLLSSLKDKKDGPKGRTGNIRDVLESVKKTLIKQFEEHNVDLKPGTLLDFALMARQRRFFSDEPSSASLAADGEMPLGGNPVPDTLREPLAKVELLLTADLVLDDSLFQSDSIHSSNSVEPGKTALLEQRENPFNPIVTYTEVEGNDGYVWLLEQRTAFSRKNTLSDEAVAEWKKLLLVDWGSANQLRHDPRFFEDKLTQNKHKLPLWFLSLQRDEQRFFMIELLGAQESGENVDAFIRSSYSFQGSTFRKTPGRKNAFVDGFRIYKKSGHAWVLYVDEFSENTLARGSVPVLTDMELPRKAELVRMAAQTMRHDLQQRAEGLHDYYTQLLGPGFDSTQPIVLPRVPFNLLSPNRGDSLGNYYFMLPCVKGEQHDDNNLKMTEVVSEAMEVCNREAQQITVGGHQFAPLFGLITHPINNFRPSTWQGEVALSDTEYDVSGLTVMLSFFISELELVTRSVANNESLYQFAKQILPLIDVLYRRVDLKQTPTSEIDSFDSLVQDYKPKMRTPESLAFVERYEAFAAYLRVTNPGYQHDAENPPEQSAAGLGGLSFPPQCRDGNCKSAKDRKGVELTKEVASRLGQCIEGAYTKDFDRDKTVLPAPLARALYPVPVSKRQQAEHARFALVFLNGHQFSGHSLSASNFALKSLSKILSPAQQEAVISLVAQRCGVPIDAKGLKEWFFERIKKASNLTALKKIKVSDKESPIASRADSTAFHGVGGGNPLNTEQTDFRGGSEGRKSELVVTPRASSLLNPEDKSKDNSADVEVDFGDVYSGGEVLSSADEENQLALVLQGDSETPESFHKAMKVLVANVMFSETNPSPLFSVTRFAVSLMMFVGGVLYRHTHEHGYTLQGDWLFPLGAGAWLGVFTYFSLLVFEVTALAEHLIADRACHESLTPEGQGYLRSIELHDMSQIYQHLRFPVGIGMLSGKNIANQTGCFQAFFPEAKWFFYTLLMCGSVLYLGAALENVAGVEARESNPVTVYTNRAGVALALFLSVYARYGKEYAEKRLHKSYSVRSSDLITRGCVSLSNGKVTARLFPVAPAAEVRGSIRESIRESVNNGLNRVNSVLANAFSPTN